MRMKASAYKQYGDAAIMSLVLEALPQIAAEIAAPLAKTDEIVLIGGSDRTTDEINKLVGSLPPAIQALTGIDLTGVSQDIAYDHASDNGYIMYTTFCFLLDSLKSERCQKCLKIRP